MLRITFTYKPLLAGGTGYASERAPVVHVFLSHYLSGSTVFVAEASAKDQWTAEFPVKRVDLRRLVRDEELIPESAPEMSNSELPDTAGIIFNAYVTTFTETKQWTRVRAGTASMALKGIQINKWTGVMQNNGDNGELLKGRVKIDSYEWIGINPRFIGTAPREPVVGAIDRSMGFYFGSSAEYPKPTFPFLRRVHCPEDRTAFGSLPGSSYALRVPVAPPSQRLYERLLQVALRRSDMSAEELERIGRAQLDSRGDAVDPRFMGVLLILSRMLSVLPNAMVYEDDFVNAGGQTLQRRSPDSDSWIAAQGGVSISEDYKIARLLYGGDCEDVADESRIEIEQLRRLVITGSSSVARLLRVMKDCANLFIVTLVLGDVTNKKLETDSISSSQALAHTFCCLIPREWFCRMMISSNSVPEDLLRRMKAKKLTDVRAWERNLRMVLIPEGTAPKDPRDRPQDAYYRDAFDLQMVKMRLESKHHFLASMFSDRSVNWRGVQVESFQEQMQSTGHDYSRFYKAVVSLYTSEFREFRTLDFTFVSATQRTYGVPFNDLVDMDDDIRLAPSLRLTDVEARVIDDILMTQELIPRLTVPDDDEPMPKRYATLMRLADEYPLQKEMIWGKSGVPLAELKTTLTVREIDLDNARLTELTQFVQRKLRSGEVSGVRVTRVVLMNKPVMDEVTPSLVVIDVELSLAMRRS